jgi:hypothetical protein
VNVPGVAVVGLNSGVSAGGAAEHVVTAGPVRAAVTSDGELRIGWDEPDWLGPARLTIAGAAAAPTITSSASEASVRLTAGWLRAEVCALAEEPVLVLRLEAREPRDAIGTGDFATPGVAWRFEPALRADEGAPEGVRAFGHQYTEFALPVFSDAALSQWRLLPIRPPVVLPLGLVAPDGRTVLLAPLTGFHEQVISVPDGDDTADAGLRAGWHGDVDAVDGGFATELAVIAGAGARDCYGRWGRLLRARSGVAAAARDADTLGTRLSYWTDNGSAYWYRTEPGLDPASTVVAAVDDLEARGVRVGSVQLDSWWYPHEVRRPFDTDEWVVPPTGMTRWEPRDDVLPGGMDALRERLGRRPLVVHCRHLSSQSPYADEFPVWVDGDRAHPQGPELYEHLLDQAVAWGVEVFEHDWLIECFLGVRGLREPGKAAAWQDGIDRALGERNLHAQWCMASPADFAHATRLRHVTSIRTSGDHGYLVGPEVLWGWFLHNNAMARALGFWPYKDVFHSAAGSDTREVEALLAALSAGPVGVGDRIGEADPSLIRRTCRADGVLVRPDVPVAATDAAAFTAPVWTGEPMVASAHTRHSAGPWTYVVSCNVGIDKQPCRGRVELATLGDDRPDAAEIALFDWRSGRIDVMPSSTATYDIELEPVGWDFRVAAPVLAGRIAVVGDAALYACAGDARVADVAVQDGAVVVTVLGAGERVTLTGWSEVPIVARAWTAASGPRPLAVSRDEGTGRWDATVEVPDAGWTRVHLSATRT